MSRTTDPNFLLLRECLSTPILNKASVTSPDLTSVSDAEELADFIDYLAQTLFASLPTSLRALTPSSTTSCTPPPPTIYPADLTTSLTTYALTTAPEAFLTSILETYIAAATTAPIYKATRTSACELCAREVPLSYHHLIPREVHKKAIKRRWCQEWELNKVAWLCRPCHSTVHRVATNEELAKTWNTVDALLQREDVKRWAEYVSKQRWGGRGSKSR